MATINTKKLKFTVYGRGYDDERGNSGDGVKDPTILNFLSAFAEFDITGRYCWVSQRDGYIKKYNTATWLEEEIPEELSFCYYINQPKNSDDNIAFTIPFTGTEGYLIDLTTGEILDTITVSSNFSRVSQDCVKVDDSTWRFCTLGQDRAANEVYTLDLENLSMSITDVHGTGICGWIDSDTMYSRYVPEWFSDYKSVSGINASGTTEWWARANRAGSSGYSNIDGQMRGIPTNGKIYVPSYVNGVWALGEYNGSVAPDFNTPSPARVFGEFPSRPTILPQDFFIAFTTDKSFAVFDTDVGLYYTDFQELNKLDNTAGYKPLATTHDMVIGTTSQYTKIFEF